MGELRVPVAVDLPLRVCCDRDGPWRDCEVSPGVRDVVVPAGGDAANEDRTRSDVLTGDAAQRSRELIAEDEIPARDLIRERRICVAVDLALRLSGDADRSLSDRQVRANIRERIVGAQRDRTQGDPTPSPAARVRSPVNPSSGTSAPLVI
jgi:hypothetical protein